VEPTFFNAMQFIFSFKFMRFKLLALYFPFTIFPFFLILFLSKDATQTRLIHKATYEFDEHSPFF